MTLLELLFAACFIIVATFILFATALWPNPIARAYITRLFRRK